MNYQQNNFPGQAYPPVGQAGYPAPYGVPGVPPAPAYPQMVPAAPLPEIPPEVKTRRNIAFVLSLVSAVLWFISLIVFFCVFLVDSLQTPLDAYILANSWNSASIWSMIVCVVSLLGAVVGLVLAAGARGKLYKGQRGLATAAMVINIINIVYAFIFAVSYVLMLIIGVSLFYYL